MTLNTDALEDMHLSLSLNHQNDSDKTHGYVEMRNWDKMQV